MGVLYSGEHDDLLQFGIDCGHSVIIGLADEITRSDAGASRLDA